MLVVQDFAADEEEIDCDHADDRPAKAGGGFFQDMVQGVHGAGIAGVIFLLKIHAI